MLAPWVISHFPPHDIYVEPFGGGGSVLIRKPRAKSEVYNDLDGEVVNVFRVLRDPESSSRLRSLLELTPFSREEFDHAHEQVSNPIELARRTIIRSFMGHGADSVTRGYKSGFRAKSWASTRDASKDWVNYWPAIAGFTQRLQGVIIDNRDGAAVMLANDTPKTLHYVDPPYVWGTRSSFKGKHGYRHEMKDSDHVRMLEILKGLSGMVILSGYPNEIYSDLGWQSFERAALADGAAERTESIWLNPACISAQVQMEIFA